MKIKKEFADISKEVVENIRFRPPQPPIPFQRKQRRPLADCGGSLAFWLNRFTDVEICKAIITDEIYAYSIGTSVEDVLEKVVKELRENSNKLTPAWRWKIMKLLPTNREGAKIFMKECNVKKNQMHRFLKFLADTLLPSNLLGSKNQEILLFWLVDYLYLLKQKQHLENYPKLITMDCTPCRAMRSKQFKMIVEGKTLKLANIQRAAEVFITDFATRLLLAVGLQFLHSFNEYNAYISSEVTYFYSRRGFRYWAKREIAKFKDAYKLERIEDIKEPRDVVQVRAMGSRGTVRPICPFRNLMLADRGFKMELQCINRALDFFTGKFKEPRYSDSPFGDALKGANTATCKAQSLLLKHYLHWLRKNHPNEKMFFITCDVAKCFSAIRRDVLRELLEKIIGDQHCVVCSVEIPNSMDNLTFRRGTIKKRTFCDQNDSQVREQILKDLRRRGFDQETINTIMTAKSNYKRYDIATVGVIMNYLDGMKFRLKGRSSSLYKMSNGVPQGCTLSQRLAHVYLLNYDKEYLLPKMSGESRLFRFADDYVFVTDNKGTALRLLETLTSGNNPYNIRFQKEKLALSFRVRGFTHRKFLTWCGSTIDPKGCLIWKPSMKRSTAILKKKAQQHRPCDNRGLPIHVSLLNSLNI